MNTLEAIKRRKSTRAYRPDQIPKETLHEILRAGFCAPVASARYDSLHITVVQNKELLNKIGVTVSELISKMMNKKMDKNFGAPTMIFVSAKESKMPAVDYANAACILENMAVAATSLEVDNIIWGGGCLAIKQDKELEKLIGIPEGYEPLLCASFGYAAEYKEPQNHTITVNFV